MATTQILKKKLKGIKSIQKVSKALKTSSSAKFSKSSRVYNNFSCYFEHCRKLYNDNHILFDKVFSPANEKAPVGLVVIAGNKGMCSSFNSDLFAFASEEIRAEKECRVIIVGQWLKSHFDENDMNYDHCFVFDDIPSYDDAVELYNVLKNMMSEGKISDIELLYPEYFNMIKQVPTRCSLRLKNTDKSQLSEPLFFPDRESIVSGMLDNVMISSLYEKLLRCAMGVQAATLMTMRSAYDTATEYAKQLEVEINKKRQSRVTSDVIETSSEFSKEEF